MGAEPRTAAPEMASKPVAGRFWIARLVAPETQVGDLRRAVELVEAEAVAAYKAELAEKVRALRPEMVRKDYLVPSPKWDDLVTRAAVLALLEAESPQTAQEPVE